MMMLRKISLLFHTIRYLRPIQLWHQVKYRLIKPPGFDRVAFWNSREHKKQRLLRKLTFIAPPESTTKWDGNVQFTFLNLSKRFNVEGIDWSFQDYGKLWNYNLQYLNYLLQPDVSDQDKLLVVQSLYKALQIRQLTLEPYPVSLRSINIIRWLSQNVSEEILDILGYLYTELDFLSRRLEYHLLGNHLLENGFALMMGGGYFQKKEWLQRGERVLRNELKEQIVTDGAHFELSPMYHQIIFFRLLELIDWYGKYENADTDFLQFCLVQASKMLSWMKNMVFSNGDIPLFNDAAKNIAYSTPFLFQYAKELEIDVADLPLSDSGYRSFVGNDYEIKIDTAQIGASYQPGHAHADNLGFILYLQGKPLFVEQGTSTYELGTRRDLERSTQAHNTVVVQAKNQSEVWGGFRVGRRAKTTIIMDTPSTIEATHNGYKSLGVVHKRRFEMSPDQLSVQDTLSRNIDAVCYLHLYPGYKPIIHNKGLVCVDNLVSIYMEGNLDVQVEEYQYSEEYNVYHSAERLVISFKNILTTTFQFP